MKQLIYRLTEPAKTIPEERKIFSDHDLKVLILPLFLEQLLEVLVGVADTFMVSYAGEAAVSGVTSFGVFAELPNTVEGFIPVETLPDDSYEFFEDKFLLLGTRNSFRLG